MRVESPVAYVGLAVLLVLILASVVTFIIKKQQGHSLSKQAVELDQRIRSWWWIMILLFGCLFLGKLASITLFMFISYLALKEFFSTVPTQHVDRSVLFWAYLSIPLQYYWVYTAWYGMFLVFIPVYVFLLLPFRRVLTQKAEGFTQAMGIIHWGVMLSVFCLSHIAFLLQVDTHSTASSGSSLVLLLLLTTQFNDIAQYICGKTFGKHKIIPQISPNKTWGGFIGGVICTTILTSQLAPLLSPFSVSQSLILGLIISSMGFVGDVVMSAVKRDLGIKDYSQLIPGHGGILDRCDSLIYTAPLFFHYYAYLYY